MIGRNRPPRHRRSALGISHVELLVAGMLLSIGLAASIKLWTFAYLVTVDTDNVGTAYNLGRQALERVHTLGFSNVAEGATYSYYTAAPQSTNDATVATYRVVTMVTSSAVTSGVAGQAGAVPASTALRTVTVTVSLIRTNAVLYTTTTYLARGGI